MGESTEGMVESTASLRKEIMALSGVDIMIDKNTFKSTYQIMDELSEKWENLTDIQQASITELMAGKHQGNVMSSLMQNFDLAREALETSINSSGSAMQEHAKWSESLEASLNRLTASWQSLSQTVMSSDFLKIVINSLTKFIDTLDTIIDKVGLLGTVLGGIFVFGGLPKIISTLVNTGGLSKLADIIPLLTLAFPKLTSNVSGLISALGNLIGVSNGAGSAMSVLLKCLTNPYVAMAAVATAAIGVAVKSYKKNKKEAEELAKKVDEVTSKYREQSKEVKRLSSSYNTSNEDSMISRYGKLSKGVNELGENVSLTTEEYSEYQDIVDTIADQIPSLITGYNSQGTAILECAGNVNALAEAYRDLIKAQNEKVLDVGTDIIKDFESNLKNTSAYHRVTEAGVSPNSSKTKDVFDADYINKIDELMKSSDDELESYVNNLSYSQEQRISKLLQESGIKKDTWFSSGLLDFTSEEDSEYIIRALTDHREQARAILGDTIEEVNAYSEELNSIADAYFNTAFLGGDSLVTENGESLIIGDYSNLDKNMQDIIDNVISNFDSSFYGKIFEGYETDEDKYHALIQNFNGILADFNSLSENAANASEFEAAFNLKTKFNDGEISYGDYIEGIQNASNIIDGIGFEDEVERQIKLNLGLTEKDDNLWVVDEYEKLINRLTSEEFEIQLDADEAREFVNELSSSELSVALNLITKGKADLSNFNIDSLREYIEKQAIIDEAMDFTINVSAEKESITALNSALSESVSASGLSAESISVLKSRYSELEENGYDISKMFEETSNGIHLNKKAVSELEKEYANSKLSKTKDSLEVLKDRYNELTEEINICRDAEQRVNLYAEQKQIVAKINDLATLASQYEGLASAYNAWQNAESAGSERDMYESIVGAFETVSDEMSRGWYDDGTIKFLELLTGQTDLASKSGKQLKDIYNSLDSSIKLLSKDGEVLATSKYSISDFFTVDKDGNSTNAGVYNFLETIQGFQDKLGKEIIKTNEAGSIIGFDFEVVAEKDENGNLIKNGDKVIAEMLGISEELVQILVRAADDAGFVINLEGAYTQLATLKTEAELARDSLIALKDSGSELLKDVDVNFNFNATGDELVEEQKRAVELLDKFKTDGVIDLSLEGAQEALDVAEYLTIKIDDLTEPKYMNIDTSAIENEDIKNAIEQMQEFERLSKTKHLISLSGEDLAETEEKMDNIADTLFKLESDTKKEIGIDVEWDKDKIAEMLEKGEIKIPSELSTKLNIDVQMSDDLKDIRLMMMHSLGLVSDEEVKLKLGFDIDDSVIDELTEEEKKVAVELVTENEDEFKKLTSEEKNAIVNLISDDSNDPLLKAFNDDYATIEAFVNIFGAESLKELNIRLDGLTDKQIQVVAEVIGNLNVEDLKNAVNNLKDKEIKAIAKALGKGDIEDLQIALMSIPDEERANAIANVFGYDDVVALCNAIEDLDPKTVEAVANALGITDVESLKDAIDRLDDKSVTAMAEVSGESDVNNLRDSIDSLEDKNITIWASIKQKASNLWDKITSYSGYGGVNDGLGYASVNGTTGGRAFARGNWRTPKTETALTGELGREIVVTPNNQWYTVGDNGAEFVKIPKNSIVFNHRQTEELLSKGKATSNGGRARALVNGTAFLGGTAYSGGNNPDGIGDVKVEADTVEVKADTLTGSSGNNGGETKASGKSAKEVADKNASATSSTTTTTSSSSSSSEAEKFEEIFDWIEVKIDRLERAIDQLDTKANSVYRSWGERNEALVGQIGKVTEEIELQKIAAQRYLQEANSVGLDESWAEKARKGLIDISTIEDEDLANKISKYQEWYDKMLDCEDKILELTETESELIQQKFDNVLDRYDGYLSVIEHEKNMLEEYINQSEAQGWLVSTKYYDALYESELSNIEKLEEERANLLAQLGEYEDSEQWYENVAAIDEVTLAIEEANTALLEYQQTIQELEFEQFDLLQEKISAVSEEADFLIELMSNKKLFDKKGRFTDKGLASVGLHGVNYNTYMYQAEEYAAEARRIKELMESSESDALDKDLEARYREMISLQQESILAAEGEKDAIKDLVAEGIEIHLDALQELIDKKKEALQSEKDLYDYQKKVKEQTKEIASLEKQMAAYAGDDSEEAKAKIQELKVSLEDAKADLEETEYEKFISDTEALLDELYLEYETILNERLDDIDALMEEMIDEINSNASTIGSTISEAASNVNYELSNSMDSIWDESTSEITDGQDAIKEVVTMFSSDFLQAATTTNDALEAIKLNTADMISKLDGIAEEKASSARDSSVGSSNNIPQNPTKPITPTTKEEPKQSSSGGDGVPKVGDKVKFLDGKYYYDSYGKNPAGSKYHGKEVYITNVNEKGTHPIHISTGKKLGSGDLGWLKKTQISGYATGKRNFLNDETAWTQENREREFIVRPSDGAILTPIAKGDSVLNHIASNNIWNMANSPAEFIRDNLNIGTSVPNNSNSQNNYTQHFENVVFSMPNVQNYDEMLSAMQKDKNFERLIDSMTIGRLAGKSSLAKGKSIR